MLISTRIEFRKLRVSHSGKNATVESGDYRTETNMCLTR